MGTVVTIPEAALDYAIYGDNTRTISNYLTHQLQQMPQAMNAFGSRIYNAMLASYNYVNDVMTKHSLMGTLQQRGIDVIDNYIMPLHSVQALQNANPTMQRWVMAHPEVKQLYNEQNIDGYSDSYVNIFGKGVGEEDYNYRLIMDGILQDDGKQSWTKHYDEELIPGDRRLDHPEKVMILSTHEYMSYVLASSDIDFTCKSDELVKINRE